MKNLTLKLTASAVALVLAACGNSQTAGELTTASAESTIVGGEPVRASEVFAKSTVAIASRNHGIFCSGSIIGEDLVITAAHCAEVSRELFVVFNRDLTVDKYELRRVTTVAYHPDWATRSEEKFNTGDMAVLKIAGGLPKGYKPATILEDKDALKNGAEVVLAGFGVLSMVPSIEATELMKVSVLLSNKDYSDTEVSFEQHDGGGACHGDSGGPAYTKVKGKWVLFGVTSRALTPMGGATCLEGSVYSSIPAQINFVKKAAAALEGTLGTKPRAPTSPLAIN